MLVAVAGSYFLALFNTPAVTIARSPSVKIPFSFNNSAGRRLGTKAADGSIVTAGSIIYRQRGTHINPGENVGRGGDDTLYAKVAGVVKFERMGRSKRKVSVYPIAE